MSLAFSHRSITSDSGRISHFFNFSMHLKSDTRHYTKNSLDATAIEIELRKGIKRVKFGYLRGSSDESYKNL